MKNQNPLDVVADHVINTSFEDLPPRVVEKVKTFLLDTIGVGTAGTSGAQVAELITLAKSWGDAPEASVWLTGERMSAQSAAIVNAYQIHCLEFDCVHEGAVLHPMATILSAAMMFENFGLHLEGQAIRDAVNDALNNGIVTEDLADGGKAYGTSEVGDWLAKNI